MRGPSVSGSDGGQGQGRPGSELTASERTLTAVEPKSPTDVSRPTWTYVLRKAAREFCDDHCTDLAGALTHYAVLAVFPAATALLSLVGLVGRGQALVDPLLQVLRDLGAAGAADT